MKTNTPFPLRHISVRVPWHDTGWDGHFCRFPAGNASCLILKRIRGSRNNDFEIAHAGASWIERDRCQQLPT